MNKKFSIIMALSITLLTSCATIKTQSPNNCLEGKWQKVDESNVVIEFCKNGNYRIEGAKKDYTARWTIIEDGRLKMDYNVDGTTSTKFASIKFIDGILVSTGDNGKVAEFEKIK